MAKKNGGAKSGKGSGAGQDPFGGPGATGANEGKIPNALREAGQRAAELAQNPMARNMLAAGLVAAAAALTSSSRVRESAKQAGRDAAESAEAAAESASRIGAAFVSAATDVVRKMMGSGNETGSGSNSGGEQPLSAAPAPRARKTAAKSGNGGKAAGAKKSATRAKTGTGGAGASAAAPSPRSKTSKGGTSKGDAKSGGAKSRKRTNANS